MRTGDTPAEARRAFATHPAGHPGDHAGVAVPAAHLGCPRVAARRADGHRRRGARRGGHQARCPPRAVAWSGWTRCWSGPPSGSGCPRRSGRSRRSARSWPAGGRCRSCSRRTRRPCEVSVEVPVEDMSTLGEPVNPEGAGEVSGNAAGPERRTSIWPAVEERILDLVRAHRSTIVFANSRRLAERLTARLNELAAEPEQVLDLDSFPAEAIGGSGISFGAPPVLARAHHGSMSREQRTSVEEDLKSGRLPCVVATSSLELGIDMGAVDLVIQVEAPPTVASGLQRVGRAGHQVGAISKGVVFPKFRGDLVSCAVVAERMASGAIEALRYPRNPLDVLAQQIVAMVAIEPWQVTELVNLVRRAAPFARAARIRARRGAGHAGRPLPERGVRRAAATDHLGPGHRRAARPPWCAAARGDFRRHDPRSGPVHRDDPAGRERPRVAGRRAGRGDGVRVAGRRRVPAGHVVLARRGHHARPGDRDAGTRPGRRGCRSGRAMRSAGRWNWAGPWASSSGSWVRCPRRRRGRGRRRRAWTSGPPTTCSATSPSSGPRPVRCPTTARSWSSGSATNWATGGWSCTRRSAPRSTARGRWQCRPGCRSGAGWTCRWPTPTTGSSCGCPTRSTSRARSCRPPRRTCCSTRTRSSRWWSPRSADRRCSRPGSASVLPGRCCSPAVTRGGGPRCGSSASDPRNCCRWPASTSGSPSCWRRCGSASRTSTTCRGCAS